MSTRGREETSPLKRSASDESEDSQGKGRKAGVQKRVALLLIAFIAGITFGVVVSERLYVEANRPLKSITNRSLSVQASDGQQQTLSTSVSNADGSLAASGAIASSSSLPSGSRCKAVEGNCELEAFLQKIAPDREVLVAISNFKLVQWGGMLNTWIEQVQQAKVKPWMVLAIDEELYDHLTSRNIPVFLIKQEIAKAQQGTGSNHAVSALKFGILAEFLKLGYSVLLSDVDIVTLSDPFQHLYRDRDIEGMTDGFDDATAYGAIGGIDDETMGWARYAQSTQHMNLNSGLFYVRANDNTVRLMQKLAGRLSQQKYWDQSAFNEEIFFLSHGETTFVPISVRVMDIWQFMNSKEMYEYVTRERTSLRKGTMIDTPAHHPCIPGEYAAHAQVFFKRWRHQPKKERQKPVMVHINYHPNKVERMKGIIEYFKTGNEQAIMQFPGGSEPGS